MDSLRMSKKSPVSRVQKVCPVLAQSLVLMMLYSGGFFNAVADITSAHASSVRCDNNLPYDVNLKQGLARVTNNRFSTTNGLFPAGERYWYQRLLTADQYRIVQQVIERGPSKVVPEIPYEGFDRFDPST